MISSNLIALSTCFFLVLPSASRASETCSADADSSIVFAPSLLRRRSESGSELSPRVEQLMVLTLNNTEGKKRITRINSELDSWTSEIQSIVGLDFKSFQSEDEMMLVEPFALPDGARQEWISRDTQSGVPSIDRKPSGSLGCAMGHRYMWTRAANLSGEGRTWSLILEDDARLVDDAHAQLFHNMLKVVPKNVHLIFLDGHCIDFLNMVPTRGGSVVSGSRTNVYARWSSAYAVTREGAQTLLKVPFKFNSDHLLNAAVKCYGLKAFCPSEALFTNQYSHDSTINVALTQTSNFSLLQTSDPSCEALGVENA
eukprot:TRINITY_DN3592_c0_g1_i1.p1 TRINITY_DN3592_c0_g1~~TRINITY_DN3592_c0_g1_i1.p1  ORF type:complete len:329 (-),score=31.73 TRINITY_DN3592_c0_g1_i1:56-994(-)